MLLIRSVTRENARVMDRFNILSTGRIYGIAERDNLIMVITIGPDSYKQLQ